MLGPKITRCSESSTCIPVNIVINAITCECKEEVRRLKLKSCRSFRAKAELPLLCRNGNEKLFRCAVESETLSRLIDPYVRNAACGRKRPGMVSYLTHDMDGK